MLWLWDGTIICDNCGRTIDSGEPIYEVSLVKDPFKDDLRKECYNSMRDW